jgi:hypothetical protein
MTRRRLENRRPALTFDLEVGGLKYTATVARFPDGGYVARDRQGKALGLFDTAHEAIDTVLKAGGVP